MTCTIGVQLTTRCDLRCAHCYVSAPPADLSLDAFTRIAREARAEGCAGLDFTGGEPTGHPRLPEILRVLGDHGLACTFVSNAWNFARVLPELLRHREHVRHLSFSLDGSTADSHDECRGRSSFDRVMRAAQLCAREKLAFGFRFTVTRANLDQLPAMPALAGERGASALVLVPLMPTPRTVRSGWMLNPADMQRLLGEAARQRAAGACPVVLAAGCFTTEPATPCPAFAGRSIFVTARGDVGCCCQLADHDGGGRMDIVGNLAEISLREAIERVRGTLRAVADEKSRRLAAGELGYLDHHPCWYCLKHFGKVEWMRALPDNLWTRDLRRDGAARAAARSEP